MSAPSMSLSCSASSVGCHAPHHCTTVVQFLLHVYGGGPTELDASLGMVCREPGRVNAHRGVCVCGDETQEQQRTVSSRMLPSHERTRGGSHAADADTLWKKLVRRTHPQVRGDTTKGPVGAVAAGKTRMRAVGSETLSASEVLNSRKTSYAKPRRKTSIQEEKSRTSKRRITKTKTTPARTRSGKISRSVICLCFRCSDSGFTDWVPSCRP